MAQAFTITRPVTITGALTNSGAVTCQSNFFSGYRRRAVTTAANTLNNTTDELIGVRSTTTTAVTITLPRVSTLPRSDKQKTYTIVDEGGNASVNNITIACNANDTILGTSSVVIDADYGSMRFYSVEVNATAGEWFCAAAVPS